MLNKILVVCIGNICRSPMGEALLADALKEIAPAVVVTSAGIGALVGEPADPIAQEIMLERNLDISKHRARQATSEILLASDLILTMETQQQQHIENKLPAVRGRVHRLGKWSGFDIVDPYRRPRMAFVHSLALIEQGVVEWQQKLFTNAAVI